MILSTTRVLTRAALLLAGVLLVALAVLTLGARLLLPLADGYRGEVESRLADRLGRAVSIGELGLRWRARGPELRLLDVSLAAVSAPATGGDGDGDGDGAGAGAGARGLAGTGDASGVAFEELLLGIDLFSSAVRGTPIIDELTLVGAELALVATGAGRFRLQGFGEPRAGGGDRRRDRPARFDVLGWMFDARRVALLDTTLTLFDASATRRLTLEAANLSVHNDGTRHRLRADLVLPPELGGPIEAGVDLGGVRTGLIWSDADLYARGADLRLGALRELVQTLSAASAEVTAEADPGGVAGDAAKADSRASGQAPPAATASLLEVGERLDADARVEFWGRWREGEVDYARARVDARDLTLAAPATAAEAGIERNVLDELSADLVYTGGSAGWSLQADRIELAGAGERTRIDDFELGRDERSGDRYVSAEGARLPLALLVRLPSVLLDEFSPATAQSLAALDPKGALLDWDARLALARPDAPLPRLSLSGELDALSSSAAGRWPGVDSLDGSIRIVDNRGRLALSGERFALARGEVSLEVEAAELALEIDARIPGQTRVDGRGTVRHGALEAELRAGITLAEGRSPRIDAQGRYAVGDVSELPPWLSIAGVPGGVDRWFRRALVGGRIEEGRIEWAGSLAEFPYEGEEPDGTFRSTFELADGELDFLSGWPRARIPSARVEIDGASLSASNTAPGGLEALAVRGAGVRIDDLRRPVLGVSLSGGGALQSLLDFANEGPLAGILRPVLGHASGTGQAGLDLALELPLYRGSGRSLALDGSLFLDGNALTFGRADLTFEAVNGAVGFSEAGVRVSNLRATLFGRPVTLNGESEGAGEEALTEIELGGAFEAADVLAHYGIPLDRFVRGASRWSVALSAPHSAARIRRDGVRLLARSDLVGTRLLLPAPLAKSSREAVPLTVSTAFRENAPMTRWRIEHGMRFRAAADVGANGLHALGARFGDGPVTPPETPGVRLDGHAPSLSVDGWATALAMLLEDLPDGEGEPEPILPVAAAVSTDALVAGTRSLGGATLDLSSGDAFLNATLDSAHLAGSLRWPREHWRRELIATVRLERLDRAFVDALGSGAEGESSTDSAFDPRLLPAIEASVARLAWDELVFEEVSLTALPVPLGTTFEMSTDLGGAATLRGSGTWRVRDADVVDASLPGRHSSALAIVLSGEDLGAGLASVGLPDVLAEGSGRVRAELAWRAPLYLPDLERASGSLSMKIDRGRIVPLEPGAARLVGLFALQAIPRRLALDFRDVTSDGLAFEHIDGDIVLNGGVAEMTLVQMTGPIGVVDITGTSNLISREYDQEITVLPRVSAALPIIGMISGGATAGIGVLVAGGFLKALGIDLDRIGLRRYALRGSWDEPRLEPLGGLPRRSP